MVQLLHSSARSITINLKSVSSGAGVAKSAQCVQIGSGAHPAFGGVKQLGHKADHLLPSKARVENEWSYTFSFPICLHGMDKNNFTFFKN